MAYIRKTRDLYVVQGNYGYGDGFEDLTQSYDRKEAKDDLKAYKQNEGKAEYKLIKRREKIEE